MKTVRATFTNASLTWLGVVVLVAAHHNQIEFNVCHAARDSYPIAFLVPQRQNALPYQWLSLLPGHGQNCALVQMSGAVYVDNGAKVPLHLDLDCGVTRWLQILSQTSRLLREQQMQLRTRSCHRHQGFLESSRWTKEGVASARNLPGLTAVRSKLMPMPFRMKSLKVLSYFFQNCSRPTGAV